MPCLTPRAESLLRWERALPLVRADSRPGSPIRPPPPHDKRAPTFSANWCLSPWILMRCCIVVVCVLCPKAALGGRRIDCWNWDDEIKSCCRKLPLQLLKIRPRAPFRDVTYPRFHASTLGALDRWWSPKPNKIGTDFTCFSTASNRADAKMENVTLNLFPCGYLVV